MSIELHSKNQLRNQSGALIGPNDEVPGPDLEHNHSLAVIRKLNADAELVEAQARNQRAVAEQNEIQAQQQRQILSLQAVQIRQQIATVEAGGKPAN